MTIQNFMEDPTSLTGEEPCQMETEDFELEVEDCAALKRTSGLFIMKTRDGRKLTQV